MHPHLFEIHPRTSDLAGENVSFEIHRCPAGKLQARNIRALGDVEPFRGDSFNGGKGKGSKSTSASKEEEDRSRDWYCSCGERNFVKRFNCFKCQAARPRSDRDSGPPRRTLSPHAGSRAMRELLRRERCSRSRSLKKKSKKGAKKRRSRSSSTSSSRTESSSHSRKKGRRRLESSSDSSSRNRSSRSRRRWSRSGEATRASSSTVTTCKGCPEVEKAKAQVLDKLLQLKSVEPKEARMKEWRALLRHWHPDKNPDRVEVATAVFQFLQKGKQVLDVKCAS